METTHRVVFGDARAMDALDDGSVDLVVTSPPYPMIELWDDLFAELNPEIADCLADGDGRRAFELMHAELDAAWAEVARVLGEGGVACVNVGDATRTVADRFRLFPNHARVTAAFADLGLDPLPDVLWRKPTNSPSKFIGSGMLPPSQYVTLEHEHVLVFRNGGPRSFEPGVERRYESAYFWEERNEWFSDLWTDVQGTVQSLDAGDDGLRERAAAFPFEVPFRLVNMYSVYGDTVLDPFWGTGTTSLAAMVCGRNSVGYERRPAFAEVFEDRVADLPALSRTVCRERLDRHRAFVRERRAGGDPPAYEAANYGFPVVTKQERDLLLYAVDGVRRDGDAYAVSHVEF